jgi:tRNA A37 threonylcarbamoyladenosine biosynthesis protein TsaE
VLGVFVGINYNGKTSLTSKTYTDYNKLEYNAKHPKFSDLESIVNHLRVFHSDCYKVIPQFNLVHHTGIYFNDRLTFLEHFLYMVKNTTQKH